ncbi:MAG TPA: hypothetical protein VJK52_04175, partial [Candidatus Nanoarchaeia archaeon]|nr:hypothetical protein [Candidatus Nanoarchaeia archaeon]
MRYKPFLILSVVLLGVVLYGNFAIAIDAAHFVGHPIFVQLSRNIGGAATAMTSCTDSDGGRFADIFGTITGTGFDGRTYRWNDQCLSPTQLLERFCINNAPGGDEINCAGCSAGVCQSSGSGGGGGGGVPPSTCTVDSQCAIGSLCLNSVCQRVTALQCSLPGDANANGRLDCADKECARRATLELPTLDCSVACMSLAPIGNPDMRVSIADYMVVTRLVEQRGINCTNQTNATQSPPAACSDGADNDRDGFIDYPADSGCTSSADTNEHGNAVCDDGLDNDGDGQRDFPSDAGCANPSDGDETNPQPSYPSSSPPPPPQSRSAISERYCTSTSQCADGALCLSNGCRRVTALGCSKPGDANDNGQINCLDVTCATTPTGAGCRRECIDVSPVGSPDGQITAADVDIIRQLTVQLGHNCNVPASPPPAPTPTPTPSGTPPPASVPPAPSSGQPECSDGRDNDLDTRIDFPRDPGCSGNTDSNEKGSMACDDGVDNDGDSKIDYHPSTPDQNDFGCEGPQDTSEKNEFGHCDNGKDDDADGKIDYPADSGCLREWDHSEFSHLNGGTCWDSDGGIILEVAGTVTGFDAGGVLRSFSDFCESDNAVKEWR